MQHLLAACVDEFKENEDLPNTTNPDDWARISGKKGERIVYIRTLVSGKQGTEPAGPSTRSPTPASTSLGADAQARTARGGATAQPGAGCAGCGPRRRGRRQRCRGPQTLRRPRRPTSTRPSYAPRSPVRASTACGRRR